LGTNLPRRSDVRCSINLSTEYTRRSVVNPCGVTVFQALVTASYSGITHSSQRITLPHVSTAPSDCWLLSVFPRTSTSLSSPSPSNRVSLPGMRFVKPHLIDRLPYRMHTGSPFEQTLVHSRFRSFCSLTRRALTSASTASPDTPRHEKHPSGDECRHDGTHQNEHSVQHPGGDCIDGPCEHGGVM